MGLLSLAQCMGEVRRLEQAKKAQMVEIGADLGGGGGQGLGQVAGHALWWKGARQTPTLI
jgi:hypothetical protein